MAYAGKFIIDYANTNENHNNLHYAVKHYLNKLNKHWCMERYEAIRPFIID